LLRHAAVTIRTSDVTAQHFGVSYTNVRWSRSPSHGSIRQRYRERCWHSGPVVLLVHPERDDRDMDEEYLSRRGLTPICVQEGLLALMLARGADAIVTDLLPRRRRSTPTSNGRRPTPRA